MCKCPLRTWLHGIPSSDGLIVYFYSSLLLSILYNSTLKKTYVCEIVFSKETHFQDS